MMFGLLWNWLSLFLSELTLQQALHQSVFMPCSSPSPSMPHCWDQHSKLLPTVAGITASKVAAWSVDEVHRAPVCIYISHLLFKFCWINASFCFRWVYLFWARLSSAVAPPLMLIVILQVIGFIQGLPGCEEQVRTFREEVNYSLESRVESERLKPVGNI